MAKSAEQRHRLLWSELVSQLVCREDVRVVGGGDGATGYVDREPGRSDVPAGRIAVTTDGKEGQILLLPDRVEMDWEASPSRSVPLNLSNAFRTGSIKNPEEDSSAYPRSAHSYSSAREAADALLPRLFPDT